MRSLLSPGCGNPLEIQNVKKAVSRNNFYVHYDFWNSSSLPTMDIFSLPEWLCHSFDRNPCIHYGNSYEVIPYLFSRSTFICHWRRDSDEAISVLLLGINSTISKQTRIFHLSLREVKRRSNLPHSFGAPLDKKVYLQTLKATGGSDFLDGRHNFEKHCKEI